MSGKLIVDGILRLAKNKPVAYLPRRAPVDYPCYDGARFGPYFGSRRCP